MKQIFSRLSSLALIIVIVVIIAQRFPIIYENFKSEDNKFNDVSFLSINQQPISLVGKKTILVFWATWCPPCKIELNRLNDLIIEKKIPYDSVVAISMNESFVTVQKYLQKNPFRFQVVLDETGQISEKYLVNVTPTVFFIDANLNIGWRTTGLSPLLFYRVTSFLNN